MSENNLPKCEIGIFGGSGFYSLLENAREISVDTPYGSPSDKITVGGVEGRAVAFLPRHGKDHRFAPHKIPYLANLWAFKELGVKRVIGPAAAGSLRADVRPGEFVICDQFVDRTMGRPSTFYPGPKVVHVSCADPYCPELRQLAIEACKKISIPVHETGTVVTVEGPRFSTRAESRWYQQAGFEVISMTQCPEAPLARELAMCYANVSLITDYDAGLEGPASADELRQGKQAGVKAVDAKAVMEVFNKNISRVKELIFEMIRKMPETSSCDCGQSLVRAEM